LDRALDRILKDFIVCDAAPSLLLSYPMRPLRWSQVGVCFISAILLAATSAFATLGELSDFSGIGKKPSKIPDSFKDADRIMIKTIYNAEKCRVTVRFENKSQASLAIKGTVLLSAAGGNSSKSVPIPFDIPNLKYKSMTGLSFPAGAVCGSASVNTRVALSSVDFALVDGKPEINPAYFKGNDGKGPKVASGKMRKQLPPPSNVSDSMVSAESRASGKAL